MAERQRRLRPRPGRAKARTKLAQLRLHAGFSQERLARFTGMSLPTYKRLERGELNNPPLRYLVNCAIVLDRKLTDENIGLLDVIEDEWLEWMPFDKANAAQPPYPPGD